MIPHYFHVPCRADIKIAWPERANMGDRMQHIDTEMCIFYCSQCGQTWREDDPILDEAGRMMKRENKYWKDMSLLSRYDAMRELREMSQ